MNVREMPDMYFQTHPSHGSEEILPKNLGKVSQNHIKLGNIIS